MASAFVEMRDITTSHDVYGVRSTNGKVLPVAIESDDEEEAGEEEDEEEAYGSSGASSVPETNGGAPRRRKIADGAPRMKLVESSFSDRSSTTCSSPGSPPPRQLHRPASPHTSLPVAEEDSDTEIPPHTAMSFNHVTNASLQYGSHNGTGMPPAKIDPHASRSMSCINRIPSYSPSSRFAREEYPAFSYEDEFSPCRYSVREFVVNNVFEGVMLGVIILNCIILAAEDPQAAGSPVVGDRSFGNYADICFSIIFVSEVILKVVAMGLLVPPFRGSRIRPAHSGGYLMSPWNVVDLIITCMSLVALFINGSSVGGLRAFRLLRLLRVAAFSSSVRVLVNALIAALPKLGHVALLYFAFLLVTSIIAVQLWKGTLRMRCVTDLAVEKFRSSDYRSYYDLYEAQRGTKLEEQMFPSALRGIVCRERSGLQGFRCPWQHVCVPFRNPGLGYQSFDHVGYAALSLFTSVTLEGWSDLLYRMQDATTFYAFLFFVAVIPFGAFFIVNLALVVISYSFESEHERELNKHRKAVVEARTQGGVVVNVVPAGYTKTWEHRMSTWRRRVKGEVRPGTSCEVLHEGQWVEGIVVPPSEASDRGVFKGKTSVTVELLDNGGGLSKGSDGSSTYQAPSPRVITVAPQKVIPAPPGGVRAYLRRLTRHRFFSFFIYSLIVINGLGLAIDHHGQADWVTDVLNVLNMVVTIVFAVEMLLKIGGLRLAGYCRDGWNLFDALVVVVCVVDLLAAPRGRNRAYSVLRCLRLLRLLKIARVCGTLRKWVAVVVHSLRSSAVLLALIFLLVFSFALLGMQLLAGSMCGLDEKCVDAHLADAQSYPEEQDDPNTTAETLSPDPNDCRCVPRESFDNIGAALLTMFQVLTGEGWDLVMYRAMASGGPWMSLFFVAFFILGHYLLLNLFVAILLHQSLIASADATREHLERERLRADTDDAKEMSPVSQELLMYETPLLQSKYASPGEAAGAEGSRGGVGDYEDAPSEDGAPTLERAFFCVSPRDKLRNLLRTLVEHRAFEAGVTLAILASTVTLCLEDPFVPPDTPLAVALRGADVGFAALFAVEAALKIYAYGFAMHRTAYLRRGGWTVLDFVVAVVSVLALSFSGLRTFRVLRAVRPLRFLSRSRGLRVVITALVHSLPPIANVFAITLLVWIVWGIMGVQLFKGTFHSCTARTWGDAADAVVAFDNNTFDLTFRDDCEGLANALAEYRESPPDASVTVEELADLPFPPDTDLRWESYSSNFDSLPAACLTLFEMATLEGWVFIMHLGMDSVSYDESPQRNQNPVLSVFFVAFIIVGSFFVMNLFISVLLDTYYTEEEKAEGGRFLLTAGQKKWVHAYREMLRSVDKPRDFFYTADTQNVLVKTCRKLVAAPGFEHAVQAVIVVNVLVMATEHFDESTAFRGLQDYGDWVFVALFTVEAGVKLVAYSARGYFSVKWNRFDFTILILSLAGALANSLADEHVGPTASIFRILRIARLLRLVRCAKGINVLLKTLFLALPSLLNVSGILALLYIVYACFAVALFGRVSPGPGIDRHANFRDFPHAVLTLFRMSTGESWQKLMSDCRRSAPECDSQLDGCASSAVAIIYFVSFMLVSMYIFLNLFIAVIIDSFDEVVKDAKADGDITADHMKKFQTAWQRRDAKMLYRMDAAELPSFLREIGTPLGVPPQTPHKDVIRIVSELDLSCIDGKVDMQPVLQALFCRSHGSPDVLNLPDVIVQVMAKKADKRFLSEDREGRYNEADVKPIPIHTFLGIIKAQAAARGMLTRQSIRRNYVKQETRTLYKVEYDEDEERPPESITSAHGNPPVVILPVLE